MLGDRYLPEGRGASRRTRRAALAIVVALGLLAGLGGLAVILWFERWSTGSRIGTEKEAERRLDQEKEPFTHSIAYDTSVPYEFKVVLDRPLTPEEQATLQATPYDEVWEYLRPLGGRLIRYPVATIPLPPGQSDPRGPADGTTFTMTLLSERSSQLSIVDMTPVNISCHAPTGRTVVDVPPQGEAFYPGVVVDLEAADPTLFIFDDGPDQGQPYFSRRRVDVGGGLEPGGLRVEALVRDQSCAWELRARYRDAGGDSDEMILRDGDQPFFAEAAPDRPEQYWLASPVVAGLPLDEEVPAFQPCHEMPDDESCPFWARGTL
ncbi:hypothetical protein [Streptomyces profundus]|uniref:hypothetical protein n=1 Tax=Streptomyces profundus TaxID=2867410 RepID=UPI001D164CDF|nr:hypothetical protein [Streptomyces sp. MA3_2.13]UED87516.1 hypothetical protein K4G22_27710 [Streptomyces sp. MA3_2.13]